MKTEASICILWIFSYVFSLHRSSCQLWGSEWVPKVPSLPPLVLSYTHVSATPFYGWTLYFSISNGASSTKYKLHTSHPGPYPPIFLLFLWSPKVYNHCTQGEPSNHWSYHLSFFLTAFSNSFSSFYSNSGPNVTTSSPHTLHSLAPTSSLPWVHLSRQALQSHHPPPLCWNGNVVRTNKPRLCCRVSRQLGSQIPQESLRQAGGRVTLLCTFGCPHPLRDFLTGPLQFQPRLHPHSGFTVPLPPSPRNTEGGRRGCAQVPSTPTPRSLPLPPKVPLCPVRYHRLSPHWTRPVGRQTCYHFSHPKPKK